MEECISTGSRPLGRPRRKRDGSITIDTEELSVSIRGFGLIPLRVAITV